MTTNTPNEPPPSPPSPPPPPSPSLTITIPAASPPPTLSSIHRPLPTQSQPPSPSPYHRIHDSHPTSDEDGKYFFMSEPSQSEDTLSSPNHNTPASSPVSGLSGAGRKRLAPSVRDCRRLEEDGDISVASEVGDPLGDPLGVPPPPKGLKGGGRRRVKGENRREATDETRDLELSSDMSFDSASQDEKAGSPRDLSPFPDRKADEKEEEEDKRSRRDFPFSDDKADAEEDKRRYFAKVESSRPPNLRTDSFLTSLQAPTKSPTFPNKKDEPEDLDPPSETTLLLQPTLSLSDHPPPEDETLTGELISSPPRTHPKRPHRPQSHEAESAITRHHTPKPEPEEEQSRPRGRRRRIYSSGDKQVRKRPPGHRRTRSGDGAAATLLTGGTEWIGMEMDDLPVPGGSFEEEEGGKGRREEGNVSSSSRSSIRRQNSGGKRSHVSDNSINSAESGTSRERRRKAKKQYQQRLPSPLSKKSGSGSGSDGQWETFRSPRHGGTVGDSDDAGSRGKKKRRQQQQQQQQQQQPEWFNPSRSGADAYPPYRPHAEKGYKSDHLGHGREQHAVSETDHFPPAQQQQEHHSHTNDNIHRMFTADDRQISVGEASISTIESNHSVFSWISNRASLTTTSNASHSNRQDYIHHDYDPTSDTTGLLKHHNDECSLNLSDDDDDHHRNQLKTTDDLFADMSASGSEMGRFLNRNSQRRRISPVRKDDPTLPLHQHRRTYTPEFFPNNPSSVSRQSSRQSSNSRQGSRLSEASSSHSGSGEKKKKKFPTYVCPMCHEEQRMFYTVNTVPKRFMEGPAAYLGVYIGVYLLVSLTILGLEEGWPWLDCVYFSVMTLTTSGLGDYVPSDDSAKIICAILIYFGIAFIGLVLGSLQANSLDDRYRKADSELMLNNCPTCARIQSKANLGDIVASKTKKSSLFSDKVPENVNWDMSYNEQQPRANPKTLQTINETNYGSTSTTLGSTPSPESIRLGVISRDTGDTELSTPVDVISRQSHTRHSSFDANTLKNLTEQRSVVSMVYSDDASQSTESSSIMSIGGGGDGRDTIRTVGKVKAAKYVFLTMKQAVANTVLIVAVGVIGFIYIEHMTLVDAFYFTMVLLTAVGYGDIKPGTSEGKIFTSCYCLVAGFVVLKNVSMISTIPLELRKRRLERAVLTQFGEELDDVALRELATGPIVRRLQISDDQPNALNKCTREMFALAMLVRLGRITEEDVKMTYEAFQRLDKDNDGVLTSREVVMSMAMERRKRGYLSSSRERVVGLEEGSLGSSGHPQSKDYLFNSHHPFSSAGQKTSDGRSHSSSSRQISTPDAPRINNHRSTRGGLAVDGQFSSFTEDMMESGVNSSYQNYFGESVQ